VQPYMALYRVIYTHTRPARVKRRCALNVHLPAAWPGKPVVVGNNNNNNNTPRLRAEDTTSRVCTAQRQLRNTSIR